MMWKTVQRVGERGKRKAEVQMLGVKSESGTSSELKTCSPDLEEHSWKASFSHMWPLAAIPAPCLPAKSSPLSL